MENPAPKYEAPISVPIATVPTTTSVQADSKASLKAVRSRSFAAVAIAALLVSGAIAVVWIVHSDAHHETPSQSQECENAVDVVSDHDVTFKRQGWYNHHQYDEDCRYDHALNVLVMDITGDGHGSENTTTLVYDFNRRLMTYQFKQKQMCVVGLMWDETIDITGIADGDVIMLPETSGRNFTSTGTIPEGFLHLTVSPVVSSLCHDFQSFWVEPVVEGSHARVARHKMTVETITTTTTAPDGTVTTTTTTTTTTTAAISHA